MVNNVLDNYEFGADEFDKTSPGLFSRIADDIQIKGYSINLNALPLNLGSSLLERINTMGADQFEHGRIGRDADISAFSN